MLGNNPPIFQQFGGSFQEKKMKKTVLLFVTIIMILGGCSKSIDTISMFHWDLPVDTDSYIYKELVSATGVEIESISVPFSEWNSKLNTLMATGDTPDLFITYGPGEQSAEKKARDGVMLDLTSYLEDYPNIRTQIMKYKDIPQKGGIFMIPVDTAIDHTFVFRKDLFDMAGVSIPETTDELYLAAKKIKQILNIAPITTSPSWTAGFFWLNPIFYAFGGAWDSWIKDQGMWVPCWISEGNKKSLIYMNRLYAEGLLDTEFFANNDGDKLDKFYNGEAAIIMHGGYDQVVREMKKRDNSVEIPYAVVLRGPDGKAGIHKMPFFTATSVNGSLTGDKLNKALRLLDYLYSDEGRTLMRFGVEGVHYAVDGQEYKPLLPLNDDGLVSPLSQQDATASIRMMTELSGWYPPWQPYRSELIDILEKVKKYGQFDPFAFDKRAKQREFSDALYDLVLKEYIKLVQSKNFDEDWISYKEKYLANGGSEMIEERNR